MSFLFPFVPIIFLLISSCSYSPFTGTTENTDDCLSVADVWKDVDLYSGKQVCVRGKAEFLKYKTLRLCSPQACDCNKSGGNLSLVSEDKRIYNPGVSIIDKIDIATLDCSGNECVMTCSPFDPREITYLETYGTLKIESFRNGDPANLSLDDLDLSRTKQLINGKWIPIIPGVYDIELETLVPYTESCANEN